MKMAARTYERLLPLVLGCALACLLPAVGAAESSTAPSIFAPGIISAGANDGAPTFSPDGKTLFFERTNSKWAVILESHLVDGRWTEPQLAPFSGTSSDQQPAFAPDGTYLVFVSSRSISSEVPAKFASHLYRVDRTPHGWSAPVELPGEVNISNRIFKPSVAANGDLFFMSDVGAGGPPKWRLFRSERTRNGYAMALALSFSGPDDGDVDPFIAPDRSYLIFSSNTRGEIRDSHEHLFVVHRQGSDWSDVAAVRYDGDTWGADDGEAQVSPDGKTLYFTSSRVMPMSRTRDRAGALEGIKRMNLWDNSNNNAWMLPTSSLP